MVMELLRGFGLLFMVGGVGNKKDALSSYVTLSSEDLFGSADIRMGNIYSQINKYTSDL